ncbi:MAG: glycosyltransferase [Candidatus Pacearchaeota archaeon]|nr:glycosyltransferase [Candidatus Pacearchaeota archaeon]
MKKIAIIIPAYNEERRIGKTLEEYSRYFEDIIKEGIIDYEILVVINNTRDGTEEIVKFFADKNNKISYINLERGGKGFAVIEGFKRALINSENYFIGFTDADMATRPDEFFKLVVACKKSDGAIADRYGKKSKIYPKPSIKRLLAKRAFNILSRSLLLLPFKDTQCGAKVFRRDALERVIPYLSMSEWAFDVELLYHLKKNKFLVTSVPIVWIDEEYSKINFWKSGPWMALGIVRLRLLNSPMKNIIKIYDLWNKNG